MKIVKFVITYLVAVFIFSLCLCIAQDWMRGPYTFHLEGDQIAGGCVARMGDTFLGWQPSLWGQTPIMPWRVERWDEKLLHVLQYCILCIRANVILVLIAFTFHYAGEFVEDKL